jgi:hypothetical protein
MHAETKKLGELLVGAGLITTAQLQEALRYQKAAGGRMGSNLVAMGIISEDSLMDFLAQQTGVPRMDVKRLDIQPQILERIPRRLAEQMTILPVAFKEPKSLVLAMADPSDLNAVDSARFASGLNIEPVVASHSSLRMAIGEQYRKLESGQLGVTIEVPRSSGEEGLPVNFDLPPAPPVSERAAETRPLPRDPFFDQNPFKEEALNPFQLFGDPAELDSTEGQDLIIHSRNPATEQVPSLESYATRTLVLGLSRLLQRRGILGQDELQRFIAKLIDQGELTDSDR